MQNIKQIISELLSQKTRLFLTIFAIAWGCASVTSMLAIGEGLRTTFVRGMENSGPGLLIINAGESSKSYAGTQPGRWVKLTKQDLQSIKSANIGIKSISPAVTFNTELKYKTNTGNRSAENAVMPNYAQLKSITTVAPGRFINNNDIKTKARVVVIGNKTADFLFKNDKTPVGKFVYMDSWPFKVIGITKDKLEFYSSGMPAAYSVYIPMSTYQAMTDNRTFSQFNVLANNPADNQKVSDKIRAIIAKNHGVDPTDPQIINSIDSYAAQSQTSDFMFGMQIFLGVIGGITLAVAGIGIANVIFASVHSSTQQIGIQIAIGAQTKHILLHYLLESIIVTTIGGVLGIVVSYLIIFAGSHINFHSQFADMLGNPKPEMSIGVLISVIIVLGITGLLAGFFPARKAAMIDPAEALRHD